MGGPCIKGELVGGVQVLTLANPPVNALSLAVRCRLLAEIEKAAANPGIRGVIILGSGRTWSAGADIREFDGASTPPLLAEVLAAVEACPKPVLAAMQGAALGGGLELAMACHIRVAERDARLGLPESNLGLLPGAGGTQRLPRLIGIDRALSMIMGGEAIFASDALSIGLIDAVAPIGELRGEALAQMASYLASGKEPRRTLDLAPPSQKNVAAAVASYWAAAPRSITLQDAPRTIARVLADGLSLLPEEGVRLERSAFEALREGRQSAALRYAFFADREVAKPAVPAQARNVAIVGIVGAGTMGRGIAHALIASGLRVVLVEPNEGARLYALQDINAGLSRDTARGRLSLSAADRARTCLSTASAIEELGEADLVIEAAFETIECKRAIFTELDRIAKPGAVLATNTSYLDVDLIASVTKRPRDVLGLHFFSPARVMKLIEVVQASATSADVVATGFALAKRLGKVPVLAGNGSGFIGNRMLAASRSAAEAMIVGGIDLYRVDAVYEAFGMPLGPFRVRDLAGLDLGWTEGSSSCETLRDVFCQAGRRGQKNGKGFYDYDTSRRGVPSVEALALVANLASRSGRPAQMASDTEILDRLLLPMVDEGCRILAEGKALRASDIDAVWRHGYGWPAWRGGPMYWADEQSLESIAARLDAFAEQDASLRRSGPLLRELADKGGKLAQFANDHIVP